MSEIDDYATTLLEQSKMFLEKARASSSVGQQAYLHASLLLAIASLEAHVNAIGEEFAERPDLSPHEKSLLTERDVRLRDGAFELTKTLKMHRLEDRIEFMHTRLSGKPIEKAASTWWPGMSTALNLRNSVTHPRGTVTMHLEAIESAVTAVIDTIDALYTNIYKRAFPAKRRGLGSKLDF